MNEADSTAFNLHNQQFSRGGFWCLVALVYLGIAYIGLGLCATGIGCLGAIANLAWAIRSVDSECNK